MEDKHKQQAIRAVEDTESEVGDAAPDTQAIEDALQRTKNILEKAAGVFDATEGWGARLAKVATLVTELIPGECGWLAQLVAKWISKD